MLRRAQAARLLSTEAGGPGPRLVLLGRKAGLIGRKPESLVTLDDGRIANEHARLEYRRGRYAIAALEKEAGTFVNGRRVRRRRRLKHGDLIRVGGAAAYRFIDPDAHLRRRGRRVVKAAIALGAVITLAGLHLKGWDGGLLGVAGFAHKWMRPAAIASPVMGREAIVIATPMASALRHFELVGPPGGAAETLAAAQGADGARVADVVGAAEERLARDGHETITWLARFNVYRAIVHESAVAEGPQLSAAMESHARYVIDNYRAQIQQGAGLGELALTEARSLEGYSAAGAAEAPNSRVSWGCGGFEAAGAIDHWVQDPFTRLAMLDPRLRAAGEWDGGSGIDPLSGCNGYTLPAGTPITLQLGERYPVRLGAVSLSSAGREVEHCAFDASSYVNPSASAQEYGRWLLRKASAVVVVPRATLRSGAEYQVSINANGRTYAWAFRVE